MVLPPDVARFLRVDADCVCLVDDLASLIRAFVPPGDRVALAEPTCGSVTRAVADAGARWVDVGRDATLRIHSDGWGFALRSERVRLGWLLSPDEPTMHSPSPALFRAAESRGLLVVRDERYSHAPGAPVTIRAGVIRLRALDWQPPNGPLAVVAIGAPETLLMLRRHARPWGPLAALPPRTWPWSQQPLPRLPPTAELVAASGTGFALRIPGVVSSEVALRMGTPAAGSTHWTWRDMARVWAWERPLNVA